MTTMHFLVQLYDPKDEMVGQSFEFPALPYPGLVVLHESALWAVEAVQVMPAHPASMSALNGDPTMVDVRVRPAEGIHDA